MSSTVHNNQNSVFSASTASATSVAVGNGGIGQTSLIVQNSGSNSNTWGNNMSRAKFPGDLEVEGNITWKGRDLGRLMVSIEDRLAILTDPDPAKLEKFAALKKAYDHYKTIEALIGNE